MVSTDIEAERDEPNDPPRRRKNGLARSVIVTTAGNVAPVVAGLITAPLLAQSLGVDGRGELAAATAPLLLAIAAITFGVPEAVTFHVARGVGRVRTVLVRALTILTIAGVGSTVVIGLLSSQLSAGDGDLANLIQLAALAVTPGLIVGGIRGYAAGRELWTLVAAERSLSAALRLASVAALSFAGLLTPVSATIAVAATTVSGGFVYLSLLRNRSRGAPKTTNEKPRMLRFGIGLWMGTLAGVLLSRLDQLVMVPLSSTYVLGIYVVAVTISEVVLVFNKSVRDVVFSAESVENQPGRLSQASRISTFVTTLGAVAVGVLSVPVIPWLFGQEFAPAVPVTIVLLIGVALGNPGSVAGAGLSARGRPILRSISLIIAAAINVGLLFLFIPLWGAMGAAFATLCGNIIAGYTNIIWMRVFYGVPIVDFIGIRWADMTGAFAMAKKIVPRRRRPAQ